MVELLSRVASAILGNKEEGACTFRMKTNSLNCFEKPLRPTTLSTAHSAIQTKIGLSGMRNTSWSNCGCGRRNAVSDSPSTEFPLIGSLHGRTTVWHSIYCGR